VIRRQRSRSPLLVVSQPKEIHMRALLALFATAFLVAGCGRDQAEQPALPSDTTVPDTTTEPAPMPPPPEDAIPAPGSEVPPQEDVPPQNVPPPAP
jgi:hypothetical protein